MVKNYRQRGGWRHPYGAAFTLAETLITLGIIGVVATLTLPNLMADYKNKTYVAQLQRSYNMFETAVQNLMVDSDTNNLDDTMIVSYTAGAGEFLKKYFKATKDCGKTWDGCLAPSYNSMKGEAVPTSGFIGQSFYCVSLNVGSSICMTALPPDSEPDWHNYSTVVIDVNGKKGPNKSGKDLFNFELYSDGKIGNSYTGKNEEWVNQNCANAWGYGGDCFSKIQQDGWVMDY